MKVGTDSLLLAAWSDLEKAHNILDIGSGTGILALFAAQRNAEARITAVEIDPDAAQDAALNFRNSPYSRRICLYNKDFRAFAQEAQTYEGEIETYDYILSNPPYFAHALPSPDRQRTQARHDSSLSCRELMKGASRLLAPEGKLGLIAPEEYASQARAEAFAEKLYTWRQTTVCAKPDGGTKRILLEFGRTLEICRTNSFCIQEANGSYSAAFRALTEPLYREGFFDSL